MVSVLNFQALLVSSKLKSCPISSNHCPPPSIAGTNFRARSMNSLNFFITARCRRWKRGPQLVLCLSQKTIQAVSWDFTPFRPPPLVWPNCRRNWPLNCRSIRTCPPRCWGDWPVTRISRLCFGRFVAGQRFPTSAWQHEQCRFRGSINGSKERQSRELLQEAWFSQFGRRASDVSDNEGNRNIAR
jgi:hypothetical protein